MNNPQSVTNAQRLALMSKIEQIPEEYIPQLLDVVQLISNASSREVSTDSWNNAIAQIGDADKNERRKSIIQELLQSWTKSDDTNEQIETLKVIESIEGVSI